MRDALLVVEQGSGTLARQGATASQRLTQKACCCKRQMELVVEVERDDVGNCQLNTKAGCIGASQEVCPRVEQGSLPAC